MDPDTDIGGHVDRFPITIPSAIVAVKSSDREVRQHAFERIIASYWKPVYKYVRIKWGESNENAKDLTQGFFATAFEKDYFAAYEADKASFQTFLRTCLDRFIANQRKAEQRLKRGGTIIHLPMDFAGAEIELAAQGQICDVTPEELFHREWVRGLLAQSLQSLQNHYRAKGNEVYFHLFERYDLPETDAKVSYASLAAEFQLTTTEVTNYLAAARREFRRVVLAKLREVTASEAEVRGEARALLGVDLW